MVEEGPNIRNEALIGPLWKNARQQPRSGAIITTVSAVMTQE